MSPLLTLVPRGWGFCSAEMCLAALGLRGKKLISPVGALSTSFWETGMSGIFQEGNRKAVKGLWCSHQALGNSQPQLSQESGC